MIQSMFDSRIHEQTSFASVSELVLTPVSVASLSESIANAFKSVQKPTKMLGKPKLIKEEDEKEKKQAESDMSFR
jgi:hypothetical protein